MNSNKDSLMDTIKKNLLEIYIDIKNFLSKSEIEKLNNEKNTEDDTSIDIPTLINNLKIYINFILHEKNIEFEHNKYNNNDSNIENNRQLESYIRKLEDDIKFHIMKQYQNKIFKDSLENKLRGYIQIEEDYEDLKEKVRFESGRFMENDRKDNEIKILRRENSNIKKEVSKIKKKYARIFELEENIKKFEKLHINDEETIKNLNLKIDQLNNRIAELKEEINHIKISNIEKKPEHSKNNEIFINDNNYQNINFNSTKISLDKLNIKSTGNNSKQAEYNYKPPFNIFNNDSRNIKSRTTKTMDNYKNLLKSNTYNKVFTTKNPLTQIRNNFYKSVKKKRNNSKLMRAEEAANSELIIKYLKSNEKNNNIKQGKSRSLRNIDHNFSEYKFNLMDNSGKRHYSRDMRKNKNNIIYEHSALNILGINRKYKI